VIGVHKKVRCLCTRASKPGEAPADWGIRSNWINARDLRRESLWIVGHFGAEVIQV
jgi:hypothetical protein